MPAVFFGHGSPMNAVEQNRYSRQNRPLEVLVDGYAFASLSMASYTVDATCPTESDQRPSAGLLDCRIPRWSRRRASPA